MVQVEGTSTWVVVTENKIGYISCGSVQVEGTSTWLFKENKGGYIPCGSFACKGFYKGEKKSQGAQVAWGLDVGTGCCRTSINSCVCLLLPYSL